MVSSGVGMLIKASLLWNSRKCKEKERRHVDAKAMACCLLMSRVGYSHIGAEGGLLICL
jgi:hypothetical protein